MTPAFSVFHQSSSDRSTIVKVSPSRKGSWSASPPSYEKRARALVAEEMSKVHLELSLRPWGEGGFA